MSSGERKRRGGALDPRRARKRLRPMGNSSARAAEAELRELGESAPEEAFELPGPSSSPAIIPVTLDDADETDEEEEVRGLSRETSVAEVIDLTQEDSDEWDAEAPAEVIDLTQEDSEETDEDDESSDAEVFLLSCDVLVPTPDEGDLPERGISGARGRQPSPTPPPSREDAEEPRSNDVPPGTIRCPICMDFYSEIVQSGRQIVSTICGHVFCGQCLYYSLMNGSLCPTCRADTDGQYHPLYI